MAVQCDITLYPGDATPQDVVLRDLPQAAVSPITIYLYATDATPQDVVLRDPSAPGGPSFPPQFAGWRVYHGGGVQELCLVDLSDAPSGMGGQLRIRLAASTLAAYLVDVGDANASPVRIRTTTGVKSVRKLI